MSPRLSVRAMMCLVLVVGLVPGLAVLVKRRAEGFRNLATYHWRMEFQLRHEALGVGAIIASHHPGLDLDDMARRSGPQSVIAYNASKYHGFLSDKYTEAAKRPWLPVQADPPTPDGYHWPPPSERDLIPWSDPYDQEVPFGDGSADRASVSAEQSFWSWLRKLW